MPKIVIAVPDELLPAVKKALACLPTDKVQVTWPTRPASEGQAAPAALAVISDLAGLAAREAQAPTLPQDVVVVLAQSAPFDPTPTAVFTTMPGVRCSRCGVEAGTRRTDRHGNPGSRIVELRRLALVRDAAQPATEGWLCFWCFNEPK